MRQFTVMVILLSIFFLPLDSNKIAPCHTSTDQFRIAYVSSRQSWTQHQFGLQVSHQLMQDKSDQAIQHSHQPIP